MHQADELTFAQIQVGDTFRVERTFSTEDLDRFAALTGDHSPLHMDQGYALSAGFEGRVIHGMLLASLFSNLVGMRVPGRHALYLAQDLAFRRPVLAGESVTAIARVVGKNPSTRTILLATEIRNAQDQIAAGGMARVKIRDGEPVDESQDAVVPLAHPGRRAVLVVGGSGGVGSATARILGAGGWSVAVHFHQNGDRARRVAREINEQGGEAFAVGGDAREPVAVERMLQSVLHRFGRLDGLVNGAMGELHHHTIQEVDWSHFAGHLDFQLKAVFQLCRAAQPHLQKTAGAVVNILSQVVWEAPPPLMADYVAAKYALKGFSKALAVEWAGESVRVNTVSPGLLRTELTEHLNERIFKSEAARTPLRRLATPEDVARAIAFLLGDEARFLTGVDLPVTGGQTMN
ncbi:MAG: SDR family oxidoreductase [Magnetococcales bacterium]|nr:SDR family oxidoreductase [Magnetococcales bacterium]